MPCLVPDDGLTSYRDPAIIETQQPHYRREILIGWTVHNKMAIAFLCGLRAVMPFMLLLMPPQLIADDQGLACIRLAEGNSANGRRHLSRSCGISCFSQCEYCRVSLRWNICRAGDTCLTRAYLEVYLGAKAYDFPLLVQLAPEGAIYLKHTAPLACYVSILMSLSTHPLSSVGSMGRFGDQYRRMSAIEHSSPRQHYRTEGREERADVEFPW